MGLQVDLDNCRQENRALFDRYNVVNRQLNDLQQSRIQLYIAYATGVIFLTVLLYLAVGVANPTLWQYTLFRTILSLGAAGIAAIIPGDMEIKYKNVLRATGALAVFFVVYKINPAALAGLPEPVPTSSFQFKIMSQKEDGSKALNCFTLPYSDVLKSVHSGKLYEIINQYLAAYAHEKNTSRNYDYYRKIDEKKVTTQSEILPDQNDGLIVIEDKLIDQNNDEHILFTMANTMKCQ